MKRTNREGDVETISAKIVFELVEKIGEGANDEYHIYSFKGDDSIKLYRCDCGDIGSFEISKLDGEEEWDTKYNDWVFVKGIIYKYHSLSTTFAGYPFLPIDKAYDKLNA